MAPTKDFNATAGKTLRRARGPSKADLIKQLAEATAQLAVRDEIIAALQAENSALRVQAFYDRLTGLSNRQGGEIISLRMITEACSGDLKLGVAMFDLDNFKAVNDILGHEAGDEALKTVARIARASMRVARIDEDHHAIRQGGDEHVFLINSPRDEQTMLTIMERVRSKIERALAPLNQQLIIKVEHRLTAGQEISPVIRERYEQGRLKVSASFGGVFFDPAALRRVNEPTHKPRENAAEAILMELLKRADQSLYDAKAKGRNQSSMLPIYRSRSGILPDCVRSLTPAAAKPPAPASTLPSARR